MLLLVVEVVIAVFYFHRFVRGFLGDVLAIPLVYTFIRSFRAMSVKTGVLIALGIGVTLEICQGLGLTQWLASGHPWTRIALGTRFDYYDLLAYGLGAGLILLIESYDYNT